MISYDPDSCRLVGRVINVSVEEAYLDAQGKVDVAKLRPITFDPVHHHYLVLGEKAGQAFSDGLSLK